MKKFLLFLITCACMFSTYGQGSATYTQVGPVKFPNNPSVQTTGIGRVSQLVYHPKDSNIIFAVTASGGVFKSSNEGNSWKPISDKLPQTSCASLAINSKNPAVMYLGTGDANYNSGGMGVWKTMNGGNTWFQSNSGMGNILVSMILMSPADTSTLLAACADGIYKSTDAGNSWTMKTTVTASYRDMMYRPQSSSILYAATNSKFYRSYNNGNSWIESTVNSNITAAGIKIATCASDTARLYCVIWKNGASSPFGGVYKSVNNGASFSLQSDTPNVLGYSANGSSMDGQGSYNLAIATDPKNANTIYIGAINIWKSTNQGASFTLKSHWGYGVHADKHGFLFSPYNPKKLYIYHDGGLDRSTNGGDNWTTLEDGLSASEFYKMGNSKLYNDYIIGGLQDNGLDVAVDKEFSTVRGGDWTGDFVFDAFDSSMLYENGGLRRNIVSNVTGNINGQGGIYAVHPKDSNVLYEITTNVYRTKNVRATPASNVTWSQLSNFSGLTGPRSIAYSKSSAGTLYIAFNPQTLYRSNNINAATPTFTKITTFPFNTNEQIRHLETCDYDSNVVYATTNQSKVYKSKDKGATWENINKNLPNNSIVKFVLDQKATDSSMYLCTAFDIYYRNSSMASWVVFSKGLPTVAQISDMEMMSDGTSNGRLHISTYGRGIWQTNLYRAVINKPLADFNINTNSSQICPNTIILVDNSTQAPTTRKWSISPAVGWKYINGTDSAYNRPEIQFTASGTYNITLSVSNTAGTNTKSIIYNYSSISTSSTCSTYTQNLGGYTIGIRKFEFNAISNQSATGNASYEDFTCSNSTIVRAGTTYPVYVTNGNSYNENCKIYIDYNDNGSFADSTELVASIASGQGRRSANIALKANPPVQDKYIRLRVVSDYYNVSSACDTLGYGQSEDYAILIDATRPSASITLPKPSVSNGFVALIKTSEVVTGFDVSDLVAANATVSNFIQVSPYIYTVQVTPVNNGQVKLGVIDNAFIDFSGNANAAISDSTIFFLGIKTYTFTGFSTADSLVQSPSGGNIVSYVPYGTKLDSLSASFTLSDSSYTYIGSTKQISSSTQNNFNSKKTYQVYSTDSSLSKTYEVQVKVNKNRECLLLTYGFNTPAATGTITHNASGGTVNVYVPFGTSLTNLKAIFTLSTGATAYINSFKQISDVTTNNFTAQLSYLIVADDPAYTKTYIVTVTLGKSRSCDLLSFGLASPAVSGIVTQTGIAGGSVAITVPFGTNLTNLLAIFSISDSASAYITGVKQSSNNSVNDFTDTVTYQVVAQDTLYSKVYTVNIVYAPNQEANLLRYDLVSPTAIGVITPNGSGGIVELQVPSNTDVTNLLAQFAVSDSASATIKGVVQRSNITYNNFSDTVLLKVLAQDTAYSKIYKIVVVKLMGVTSLDASGKILIYPNPAVNALTILHNDHSGNEYYRIVNALGQTVLSGNINQSETGIDVSELTAGIYHLVMLNNKRLLSAQFVKQ